MGTKTPPPRTNTLHTQAGVLLATSEATVLAAGDTIQYQNTGNVVLRIHVTTPGTATIVALIGANNQPLTLSTGDVLVGPLDPGIFGQTVNITTATAVGSVGTYLLTARFPNGLRNPFETNAAATDSN